MVFVFAAGAAVVAAAVAAVVAVRGGRGGASVSLGEKETRKKKERATDERKQLRPSTGSKGEREETDDFFSHHLPIILRPSWTVQLDHRPDDSATPGSTRSNEVGKQQAPPRGLSVGGRGKGQGISKRVSSTTLTTPIISRLMDPLSLSLSLSLFRSLAFPSRQQQAPPHSTPNYNSPRTP